MTNEFPYLHGFSKEEQDRLREQARFGEQTIYRDIYFTGKKKILEVGCGVGAQSEILLRRFPEIDLTGIDLNDAQLEAAKKYLPTLAFAKDRFQIKKMSATDLEFESNSFEGAFLCWVLEHISDPAQALAEVRRVLKPGSKIYVTEVMNSSFFLEPYSPNVWKYWMAFNDYQYDQAGDPFVGAKLGNLLTNTGFRDIETKIKTWHLDNRKPGERKEVIEYWTNLLLSAKDQLIKAGCVSEEVVKEVVKELKSVRNDPNAVFFYSFVQATARVY